MANEADTKITGGNHGGGVISRDSAYRKTAAHFDEALAVLVAKLQSKNESIALGAANKIIDKCLPDLKATELTGQNGEPIKFTIITGSGFVPQSLSTYVSSTGSSSSGSTTIQSSNLAPQSTKDNNSDNRGN